MSDMSIDEALHEAERQGKKLDSILDQVDELEKNIIILQKEYQDRLEAKETIIRLNEATMSILSSDKDTVIDMMNSQRKQYRENVQRCIDRIEREKYLFEKLKGYGDRDYRRYCYQIEQMNNNLKIIKEEMGCDNE